MVMEPAFPILVHIFVQSAQTAMVSILAFVTDLASKLTTLANTLSLLAKIATDSTGRIGVPEKAKQSKMFLTI